MFTAKVARNLAFGLARDFNEQIKKARQVGFKLDPHRVHLLGDMVDTLKAYAKSLPEGEEYSYEFASTLANLGGYIQREIGALKAQIEEGKTYFQAQDEWFKP